MVGFTSSFFVALSVFGLLFAPSLSIPTLETTSLAKRDDSLYTLWNSIPLSQTAQGDSALYFSINQQQSNAWRVTFLYGCTAILITDPNNVIVGHIQQNDQACSDIKSVKKTQNYIVYHLDDVLQNFSPNAYTQVYFIVPNDDIKAPGLRELTNELTMDWGVNPDLIKTISYCVGDNMREMGMAMSDSPNGLTVVQWITGGENSETLGTLNIYMGNVGGDNPISSVEYKKES